MNRVESLLDDKLNGTITNLTNGNENLSRARERGLTLLGKLIRTKDPHSPTNGTGNGPQYEPKLTVNLSIM